MKAEFAKKQCFQDGFGTVYSVIDSENQNRVFITQERKVQKFEHVTGRMDENLNLFVEEKKLDLSGDLQYSSFSESGFYGEEYVKAHITALLR